MRYTPPWAYSVKVRVNFVTVRVLQCSFGESWSTRIVIARNPHPGPNRSTGKDKARKCIAGGDTDGRRNIGWFVFSTRFVIIVNRCIHASGMGRRAGWTGSARACFVYGFVEIALVVIEMSGFASKHEINEH